MSIAFTKMNSQGNDFIIIDNTSQNIKFKPELILSLCSRETIGCDQLLIIKLGNNNSVECIIYNQDGTQAKQCGNGMRAIMLYLKTKFNFSSCSIIVGDIAYEARYVDENNISIDMGAPFFLLESPNSKDSSDLTFESDNIVCHVVSSTENGKLSFSYAPILIGNFHCVVFSKDCYTHKEHISNILNSVYDDGANISFLLNYHELTSDPTINLIIRVNERGAGWTKSCGSAASAAGAFCIQNFLKDNHQKNSINVEQEGGTLKVNWGNVSESQNEATNLTLIGPSTYEYDNVWNE